MELELALWDRWIRRSNRPGWTQSSLMCRVIAVERNDAAMVENSSDVPEHPIQVVTVATVQRDANAVSSSKLLAIPGGKSAALSNFQCTLEIP